MKKGTIINIWDDEEEVSICSCVEKYWKLMERLGCKAINVHKYADGRIYSKEYLFPKRWMVIKKRKELIGEAFERGKKGSERVSKLLKKSKNKDII